MDCALHTEVKCLKVPHCMLQLLTLNKEEQGLYIA